jgi:hypothetical protein
MSKHYVGDVGTSIVVDVGTNISRAKKLILMVQKPKESTTTQWNGTLQGTTKIKYVVKKGDWNKAGTYKLQVYVEMPGWSGYGDLTTFKIHSLFT